MSKDFYNVEIFSLSFFKLQLLLPGKVSFLLKPKIYELWGELHIYFPYQIFSTKCHLLENPALFYITYWIVENLSLI